MSEGVLDRLLAGETVTVSELRTAVVRSVFGDRIGALVGLAAIVWFALYWELNFFSSDQYTFANTLVGVVEGHLSIDEAVYGPPSGSTPGTSLVDGRVYGRNYGVVVVSAVWLVVYRLLSVLLDLRVLLVGLWSLAVAVLSYGIGTVIGRERAGTLLGAGIGAAVFVGNLAVATPLPPRWLPVLALQTTTALAAAFVAVVCYRLGNAAYTRRVGLAMGVVAAVGTPVGFWATVPKRHSVTALLVVLAMYTLYRSRAATTRRRARRFRALTYAWVGAAAWVHAAEGFILLLAVAAVDLPTARSNRARDLAVVGVALFLSLVPFFLTNWLIAGNPVEPPRLLPNYGGDVLSPGATEGGSATQGGAGGGTTGGDTASAESTGDGSGSGLSAVVATAVGLFGRRLPGLFMGSYGLFLTDPGRIAAIFVRTGYLGGLTSSEDAAVNLSVLASMPLLGALVAAPMLAGKRHLSAVRSPNEWSAIRVLDAFSVGYVVLLLGVFLGSLPVHHMFTVRYLHPLYVVGVYWLARLPAVRRVVDSQGRVLAATTATTAVAGTGVYLAAIAGGDLVLDESVQVYALWALAVAVVALAWAVLATTRSGVDRAGAVVLGVAAGSMAAYLLVSGLSLFPVSGEFLLPGSRVLSDAVHYTRLYGSSPPF
ncbi:hypothetical protein [Haloarcula halophila]|uniref:hypothetical protein n=1 Tax=Haloarcula TaxID=2237 RepID=UPI0023E3B34E|nr:hypothetical protein [Halomicroarcula sp. DFY41]